MVTLRPLSVTDGKDVYEFLQRLGPEENGFVNKVNGMTYEEYRAWLKRQADMAEGIGLEDGMVPQSTYWLLEDGVPVGIGRLRHRLTDALREAGGVIGYGIDPLHRGRGCGKALLRLLLEETKRIGMTDLLLTVRLGNIASRKVAESCGGRLLRENEIRAFYEFH